jgi:hypothetical protein
VKHAPHKVCLLHFITDRAPLKPDSSARILQ